jgi:CheY-like chemotaxis protein
MKPILLIAESDADLRDAYSTFLAGRGYDVETAVDGLDCLEKLRRLAPAVCVLDRELHWGGADGVIAWLREERATPGVSVPPVVTILPKPFGLTALLESVRGLLEEPFNLNRTSASPEYFIG